MKKFILPVVTLMVLLASCSSSTYPTSRQQQPYPNTYPGSNPYPPSNRHPDETVIVDRNGRVISRDGRVIDDDRSRRVYRSHSQRNLPPKVITINDRYARRDSRGQWYYTDANGYVYWRRRDGYYELD